MTEAEWLACCEPTPMIRFLVGKASDRKLRLFGVAYCRLAWQDLEEPRIRELVLVAERFADGVVGLPQLRSAWGDAMDAYATNQGAAGNQDVEESVLGLGEELVLPRVVQWAGKSTAFDETELWERIDDPKADQESRNRAFAVALDRRQSNANAAHAALLRDIFGNPFRPATFDPVWRTSTAVALASQMYESRDFGAMPILADALQDAGCDNDDVLNHCRGPGPHVRGCWVVDLVLGK